MKTRKKQSFIQKFLSSKKQYPVIAAISVGLYPIIFYFTNNYTLINTWAHLLYFILVFLGIPIVLFVVSERLSKRYLLSKWQKYVLPFLNVFFFLFLLKVCLYAGVQKKMILGIIIIAILFAILFHKQLKKIIVIQFILIFIGLINLAFTLKKQLNYSEEWKIQPDDIAQVLFKKKPNVYFIQPDGYTNFSELKKGYYHIDNNEFGLSLKNNGFKLYNDFRSNYEATLSSNSSLFMMKHHYYNNVSPSKEFVNARNIILSKNTVLDIFKNNGYKSYFLAEKYYLLLNRPKLGYDECNFNYSEIPFISTGLGDKKSVISPFKEYLKEDSPKFFFIEIFNPKHINGRKLGAEGVNIKREVYKENLQLANQTLDEIILAIKAEDPNALIIIMADHGGYVGMEYLQQGNEKTQDRDKIYSIFSSALAIHWSNGVEPKYDTHLKSAVNVFRIIFSYLSENEAYLNNLQEDGSYSIIYKGDRPGIYQYIDKEGTIVFNSLRYFND